MTRWPLRRLAVLGALTVAIGAALLASGTSPASAGVTCAQPGVQGNTYTRLHAAPGLVVPDNDAEGASSCMTFSSTGEIQDLNVSLIIEHRWPGDIVVTLTHDQTGTTVALMDRPGVPATGIGCGEDGDDINVMLDDEAAAPVENVCAPATPTIAGTFRPNQALSMFDGEALTGTWTLRIVDSAFLDTGVLHAWSMTVGSGGSGDVDCNGTVNTIDAGLTLQFVAGIINTLACRANADTNLSGAINSIDVALILQKVAGLIPSLPA
ncbi:MAG: proprotein convertase P-domain-containing protein [Dehalococcoidia bacterium]